MINPALSAVLDVQSEVINVYPDTSKSCDQGIICPTSNIEMSLVINSVVNDWRKHIVARVILGHCDFLDVKLNFKSIIVIKPLVSCFSDNVYTVL